MHISAVLAFVFGNNSGIPITGINVSRKKDIQEQMVYDLVQKTSELIGIPQNIPRDAVTCFEEYVGTGYSVSTKEMVSAVRLLAELSN